VLSVIATCPQSFRKREIRDKPESAICHQKEPSHAQGQHICSFSVAAALSEATGAPHPEAREEAIRAADAAHMLSLCISDGDARE
jgi:hypothetical protein